jgi:hypothetical protein
MLVDGHVNVQIRGGQEERGIFFGCAAGAVAPAATASFVAPAPARWTLPGEFCKIRVESQFTQQVAAPAAEPGSLSLLAAELVSRRDRPRGAPPVPINQT